MTKQPDQPDQPVPYKYLHISSYPEIPKGSMGTGRPQPGVEITYDDGKEKFTVCCDDLDTHIKNRDKCMRIILAYLNSRGKYNENTNYLIKGQ